MSPWWCRWYSTVPTLLAAHTIAFGRWVFLVPPPVGAVAAVTCLSLGLRFVRYPQRFRYAALLAALVSLVLFALAFESLLPVATEHVAPLVLFASMFYVPALLAHRQMAPALHASGTSGVVPVVAASLVYPCAFTLADGIITRTSAFGSVGSIGYACTRIPLLVHLTAYTGLSGCCFLLSWLASAIDVILTSGVTRQKITRFAMCVAGILLVVLCLVHMPQYGSRSSGNPELCVVSVAPPASFDTDMFLHMTLFYQKDLSVEEWGNVSRTFRTGRAHLIAAIREGLERARKERPECRDEEMRPRPIVLTSELGALVVGEEEQEQWVEEVRALTTEEGVWMSLGSAVLIPKSASYNITRLDNTLVWMSPSGTLIGVYRARRRVPGPEEDVVVDPFAQQEPPPLVFIPWDSTDEAERGIVDDEGVHSQAGSWVTCLLGIDVQGVDAITPWAQRGVDLIVMSTLEWPTAAEMHQHMAIVRGVEHGASVVKQTAYGLSHASDPMGHVMNSLDYFHFRREELRIMVSVVPGRGRGPTVYSHLGEWISTLSMALFVFLFLVLKALKTSDHPKRE